MPASSPLPDRLRVAHLSPARDNEFDLKPDAGARAAIAAEMELSDLPKLRFTGRVRARGSDEWVLDGTLRATVVQPCVVTLDPVTTPLEEQVSLVFSPHVTTPEEDEIEMGDETIEPLGQWIDLGAIALEALALALPTHPRKDGAELPEAAADDDAGAASAETRKPFAGLADLMKKDPG
ncbi:DUF177 domain-containing protein [Paracoccus aurantiacus]|uniref:DUF177 domain-containing protein n=1 Tax=Paracoccus aurantiacus TaxID=2599412 RepID=A0A5C6S152_9RHOB|nr:DUF177 domain-containing protein [Paracoccus aurantiacus]TXB68577.1 DUF177 domain-containing protein [Paracoccus aurantiacus]